MASSSTSPNPSQRAGWTSSSARSQPGGDVAGAAGKEQRAAEAELAPELLEPLALRALAEDQEHRVRMALAAPSANARRATS